MTILLNNTGNPITRDERNKINENWQRIIDGLTNLQMQIKVLAGGQEVDELIARLEKAIENAETDLQNYIEQINSIVQVAIDKNNTATQQAIDKNNFALQAALGEVSDKLIELSTAISNAETATSDTTNAKNSAIQATQDAQNAISNMQSVIDNTVHRGEWNSETQYFKNNMAVYNGSTFISLQDNLNKVPPTLPTQSNAYWSLFAEKGDKGSKGDKGDTGAALSILGKLTDPSQLPPTGQAGQAYAVNGELYVWSENLDAWENVGNIKGEKGDKGDTGEDGLSAYQVAVNNGFVGTLEEWLASLKGEKGDKGQDADLTEVNQEISNLQQTVTNNQQVVNEHLSQMATSEEAGHVVLVNELTTGGVDKAASAETVKTLKSQLDTHGNDSNKHLVNGERTTWNNKLPTFATPWKEGLDPNTHTDTFYVSDHPNLGGGYWYVENRWYGDKSNGILMQVATSYTGSPDQKVRRKGQDGSWTAWSPSFQSLKQSVSDWKAAVNQAVTDMGVYTAPDATFATTAANIRAIPRAQTGTMYVPSLSAGQTASVDVTVSGFTPKNAYCMAGGIVMIDGSLGGNSLSASTLVTQNIQVIGTTVRYTLYVGSGGSGWSGGNIKYVIS